jgi:hypothetical protein
VYSQEALDRITSMLMEQHPTSNAPGPATQEALAHLGKKKVDKEMLGSDGKAECSVCMDDVQLDEEVSVLPCKHWFHEACVTAWLKEHNTCPICRTGVGEDGSAIPPGQRSQEGGENERRRGSRSQRTSPPGIMRFFSSGAAAGSGVDSGNTNEQGGPSAPISRRRNRSPSPSSMPGGFSPDRRRRTADRSSGIFLPRRESDSELDRVRTRRDQGRLSDEDRRSTGENSTRSNRSSGSGSGMFSGLRRFLGGGGRDSI